MQEISSGNLRKMRTELADPVQYRLPVGDDEVGLNALLGKTLRIEFLGEINCVHCGRKTSKSFNQGFCYPCFRKLAQCDSCILKPEQCHYHEGTCREPEWGDTHCMIPHFVYLANTSGIKVGITRHTQVPTRWIDQGATQALPIMHVATRQQSGFAEVMFKDHVADKTNWRALFRRDIEDLPLAAERDRLRELCMAEFAALEQRFGLQALQWMETGEEVAIRYPILDLPDKIASRRLDKMPTVEGTLTGIKGQYLILDTGVMNIRNHAAYAVRVSSD